MTGGWSQAFGDGRVRKRHPPNNLTFGENLKVRALRNHAPLVPGAVVVIEVKAPAQAHMAVRADADKNRPAPRGRLYWLPFHTEK